MEIATLIFTIAGALFGGASAYVSVYSNFRDPKIFEKLVLKARKNYPGAQNTKRVTYYPYYEYLDKIQLHLPFLYAKIKRKFLYAIILIFTSGLFVGIDFPSGTGNFFPRFIEWFDVAIYCVQLAFIFLWKDFILTKDEKGFLKHYQFLMDQFYKEAILPNISEFRKHIEKMQFNDIKKKKDELKTLREAIKSRDIVCEGCKKKVDLEKFDFENNKCDECNGITN